MRRLLVLALCIAFASGHVLPNLGEISQQLAISEDNTPANVKKISPPGIKLFNPVQTLQIQVDASIPPVYSDPLIHNIPITINEPVPIIQEVVLPLSVDDNLPEIYEVSQRDEVIRNVQNTPVVLVEQIVPIVVDSAPVVNAAAIAPLIKTVPVETIVVDSAHVVNAAAIAPLIKTVPVETIVVDSAHVVNAAAIAPLIKTVPVETIVVDSAPVVKAPEPLDAPNPPMPSISIPYVGGQFHAQDELGQYSFGYHGGPSTRIESKDYLGRLSGSFAYVNSEGEVHYRKYSAAPGVGFNVIGSDIPVDDSEPPKETEEVLKVRASHLKLLNEAKKSASEKLDVLKVETEVEVTRAQANQFLENKAIESEIVSEVSNVLKEETKAGVSTAQENQIIETKAVESEVATEVPAILKEETEVEVSTTHENLISENEPMKSEVVREESDVLKEETETDISTEPNFPWLE